MVVIGLARSGAETGGEYTGIRKPPALELFAHNPVDEESSIARG